ncbi:MAG TPA: hypothetical protein DEG55_05445 [Acidaminococcaceae bacterium]|nr:hypothetical protein [Acidaminococcaceae bacterium]
MTITEVSEKYKIPFAVLQRYAAEKTGAEGRNEKHGQAEPCRKKTCFCTFLKRINGIIFIIIKRSD